MPDNGLGPRWRNLARIVAGERAITAGARAALEQLLAYAGHAVRSSHYRGDTLSAQAAGWARIVETHLQPPVTDLFIKAWDATSRGALIDPTPYATRHLESVWSRLQGVPDDVFDVMRSELAQGHQAGESVTQLAARVDGVLSDDQRWTNRARTIARTEVIGANNGGAHASAYATAGALGTEPAEVVKEWLATSDSRTRETHADANGQQVRGLDGLFQVGDADLSYAADPAGDPAEVINCRCTVLYHYPGDPAYPTGELAGPRTTASTTEGPAAPADPVGVQYPGAPREHPVDPGPQNDTERMARAQTLDELIRELKTGSANAKSVARAELTRRGFPGVASGRVRASAAQHTYHEHDLPMEAAVTTTPPEAPTPTPEADEPPECVVVALPAASDPCNPIGAEQKHATLMYLGDQMTDDDYQAAVEALGAFVTTDATMTFDATVTGVESLGPAGARVWMLTADPAAPDSLESLRGDLTGVDALAGPFNATKQFPSYTPHVTIGYPADPDGMAEDDDADTDAPEPADDTDDDTDTDHADTLDDATEQAAAAISMITFDRLAIWRGEDQHEFPLAAGTTAPATPDGEAVAAALEVLRAFTQASSRTTHADAPLPEEAPAAPGTPARAQDIAADGDPFHGILWPEATMSGDGRQITAGATVWRDLPLPLMAQDAQAMGHDGAVRVGRIDTITRDDTTYSVPVLRYSGVWDTSPAAIETARQVGNGVARGVSVDGDDVTVELQGSDGQPLDPMVDDFPDDGVVIECATSARVAGATVCSIPAFQQAYVANGVYEAGMDEPGWTADGDPIPSGQVPDAPTTPTDAPTPVMASAWSVTASFLPVYPASHFTRAPELDAAPVTGQPLTVTEDGRVFGHLAVWGTCHIGIDGICQEPPSSRSGYAHYAAGVAHLDNGEVVHVGPLTMGTGHAAMGLNARAAAEHYDNTGTVVADVVMGEDAIGPWFSGRVRSTTTPEQVHAMVAAGKISGDWREVVRGSGELELVAALIVNVPGFSIPRPALAASAGRPVALVASGIVNRRDAAPGESMPTAPSLAELTASVLAAMDRRTRHQAAVTRLRTHRVTAARSKLTAAAVQQTTRRRAAALARLTKGA